MKKTVLIISGALLISGMAVQMAAASEHHVTKANLGRHHVAAFRGAYDQMSGPTNVSVSPPAIYRTDTGSDFRRVDPSWIGDKDPSLSPAD